MNVNEKMIFLEINGIKKDRKISAKIGVSYYSQTKLTQKDTFSLLVFLFTLLKKFGDSASLPPTGIRSQIFKASFDKGFVPVCTVCLSLVFTVISLPMLL